MNIVSINTSQPVWKDWIAFHNCLKANKAGILVEAMLHITNYWLILPFLFVIEMLLVFQADIIALSKGKNRVHSVPRLHLPPCITATLSATGKHCPNLLRAQMASSCGSVISIAQWMQRYQRSLEQLLQALQHVPDVATTRQHIQEVSTPVACSAL